jgi:hypothetical protein
MLKRLFGNNNPVGIHLHSWRKGKGTIANGMGYHQICGDKRCCADRILIWSGDSRAYIGDMPEWAIEMGVKLGLVTEASGQDYKRLLSL